MNRNQLLLIHNTLSSIAQKTFEIKQKISQKHTEIET